MKGRILTLMAMSVMAGCGGRPMIQRWPVDHPANAEAPQSPLSQGSNTLAIEADEGPADKAKNPIEEKTPEKKDGEMENKHQHGEHETEQAPTPAPKHQHGGAE